MDELQQELRIVRIKENLGKGKYISEDVFNQEKIGIRLSGKLRIYYSHMPIGEVVYVNIVNFDIENAIFIYTWRNAMSLDNSETVLNKQRKVLDAQFIEIYGTEEYLKLPK